MFHNESITTMCTGGEIVTAPQERTFLLHQEYETCFLDSLAKIYLVKQTYTY